MDTITMEKRSEGVKAKHLRRAGIVPCCVYGGELPAPFRFRWIKRQPESFCAKSVWEARCS